MLKTSALSNPSSSHAAARVRAAASKTGATATAATTTPAASTSNVLSTVGHAIASGASEVASATVTLSERALHGFESAGKAVVHAAEEVYDDVTSPGVRKFAGAIVDGATDVVSDVVSVVTYAALI